jgi:hypothetical protein
MPILRPAYRLYVDEVGDHTFASSYLDNHRYLSLTGVIVGYDYASQILAPAIDDLSSRFFGGHRDEPVILHRREMVRKTGKFACLRDPELCQSFDEDFLELLRNLEYTVITAVIDKEAHKTRYRDYSEHPYHYCLEVVLERYVLWLHENQAIGDVMIEARGGNEDRTLKESFTKLYESKKAWHVPQGDFSRFLTSRELKVKQKRDNIAGLQLTDLIAQPAFVGYKAKKLREPAPTGFGSDIYNILVESKFRRNAFGTIETYGNKWLP